MVVVLEAFIFLKYILFLPEFHSFQLKSRLCIFDNKYRNFELCVFFSFFSFFSLFRFLIDLMNLFLIRFFFIFFISLLNLLLAGTTNTTQSNHENLFDL